MEIAVFFFKSPVDTTAEVNFDEVEVPLVEVSFCILDVVIPKAGTQSVEIMIVAGTAGVVPGIGIDSSFQTGCVNVVYEAAHSVRTLWKPCGMRYHIS